MNKFFLFFFIFISVFVFTKTETMASCINVTDLTTGQCTSFTDVNALIASSSLFDVSYNALSENDIVQVFFSYLIAGIILGVVIGLILWLFH